MAAQCHLRIIDIRQFRQVLIGIDAAAAGIGNTVAVSILRIVIIEKGKIGEVHHDLVAIDAPDLDIGSILRRIIAVVDRHLMVDITAVGQTGLGRAMAVFIQRQNDIASSGKFDRIGRTGLMVILIAMQKKHSRGLGALRSAVRYIELVSQITDLGLDLAVRDLYGIITMLDVVCHKHAGSSTDQHQNE